MRTGALQNLITIQRKVQLGVTKLNEPNWVWQDFSADVPVEVTVVRGKEHFDSQTKQRYSEDVYRFRMDYDEAVGIEASMRVLFEDIVLDIKAILPDNQMRDDCVIECTMQDGVVQGKAISIAIETAIEDGIVGEAYESFTLLVVNGTAPYTFSDVDSFTAASTLPPGLTINSDGEVTGTPTAAGTYSVVLTVKDSANQTTSTPAFDIVVTA